MKKPFEVGERVAVYCGSRVVGVVTAISLDTNIMAGPIEVTYHGKNTRYVHPKQCRRLVKKSRRRIWIYPREFSDARGKLPPRIEAFTDESNGSTGAIEFVEVKRK